jgi:hypothetical protein
MLAKVEADSEVLVALSERLLWVDTVEELADEGAVPSCSAADCGLPQAQF